MTVLVTAALVRLLSLLFPLCPPVLSSFDFSVSEMNELRKYWYADFLFFLFFTEWFSLLSFSVYYFFLWFFCFCFGSSPASVLALFCIFLGSFLPFVLGFLLLL
jgi:hypothetical protein